MKICKKELLILGGIILFAYVLRILPYLVGYRLPFTEDGIRDFQQIKFFLENGKLNLFNSYGDFGAFPFMHLMVAMFAKVSGVDPLRIFLFIPQLLSSIGLVFYYFYLSKYFSKTLSLFSILLIALFGPHIHWSSQPVRETIGLFLFPLIIWLYDKYSSNMSNKINLFWLVVALLISVTTHHWSCLMILFWIIFYNLFFNPKNRIQWIVPVTYSLLLITYWHFYFQFFYQTFRNVFFGNRIENYILISLLSSLLYLFIYKIDLEKIRKNKLFIFFSGIIMILGLILVSLNILPIDYPIQIWLMLITYLILIYIGYFFCEINENINKLLKTATYIIIFWLLPLPFLFQDNSELFHTFIDPFRTMEFAIYPLSVIAAFSLIKIANYHKIFLAALLAFLCFLASLTYPPIFVYGQTFIGTPLYDVRSNIRHIDNDTISLIKWANDHNYYVDSILPEIRSYQETFLPKRENHAILWTKNDDIVEKNLDKINDGIVKVLDPVAYKKAMDPTKILYNNKSGAIYQLKYNAKFIDIDMPSIIELNKPATARVKILNNGSVPWDSMNFFILGKITPSGRGRITDMNVDGPKIIMPGEEVLYTYNFTIAEASGEYKLIMQMRHSDYGFFGQPSEEINFKILKSDGN